MFPTNLKRSVPPNTIAVDGLWLPAEEDLCSLTDQRGLTNLKDRSAKHIKSMSTHHPHKQDLPLSFVSAGCSRYKTNLGSNS
jgi:hypothetical protein